MILKNLVICGKDEPVAIRINGGRIDTVSNEAGESEELFSLNFNEAIAFPGLINSHDHLDFNSFPRLGNKVYDHYVPWGEDIHAANRDIIRQVLEIPKELRVQWSLYKNLINGITTVVQHGEHFTVTNELIDVFQDCVSIHSVRLEKNWKIRLNKPRGKSLPVVIHIGEGTNEDAKNEIDELIRWNFLRRDLVGIHGIAMSRKQAKSFKALIWCPDSNYFLFQKTADIPSVRQAVPILFGTDSTLTAGWDIWKQMRMAMATGWVTGEELYHMLTKAAARVWGFEGKGELRPGAKADIVISRKKETEFMTSFLALEPEQILLVLHMGNIRLFDQTLLSELVSMNLDLSKYSKIGVGNSIKYVYGNLPELITRIRSYHSSIDLQGIHLV